VRCTGLTRRWRIRRDAFCRDVCADRREGAYMPTITAGTYAPSAVIAYLNRYTHSTKSRGPWKAGVGYLVPAGGAAAASRLSTSPSFLISSP
jgi:hypothetical protein